MRGISVLFFLMTLSVFGQETTYNLMLKNQCNGKVERALLYELKKSGIEFVISDTIGTILLKETGKYRLSALMIAEKIEVDIKKGKNVDTLQIVKIEEYVRTFSHSLNSKTQKSSKSSKPSNSIRYHCCGETCEGNQIDYYNNGNKRIEGTFEKGLPKGKVTFYYPNGKVKEVRMYNEEGILEKEIKYDTNGKKL